MFLLETINVKASATGSQTSLKSGSFAFFTITKKISSNLYRISLNGNILNVKTSVPLIIGSKLKAQIFWNNNRLQLKVLNKPDPIGSLLDKVNIPSNSNTKLIAEGLIRSGIPFNPIFFEKIQSIIKRNKKVDEKLIKTMLLLIEKGIPCNSKNISEIFYFDNQKEDRESQKQNTKDKKSKKKNYSVKEIKNHIKRQILGTDTGNELLKYFNHRIALHDNWLMIPLNYSFLRNGRGVLKLRLDGQFLLTNMVLRLDDGMEWEFTLKKQKDNSRMNIWGSCKNSWELTESFSKLKEKLYNIGIIIDDINKEQLLTDGFTELGSGSYDSINYIV